MMVETDGPWPFEGPFQDKLTHPSMIHHSIQTITNIKRRLSTMFTTAIQKYNAVLPIVINVLSFSM